MRWLCLSFLLIFQVTPVFGQYTNSYISVPFFPSLPNFDTSSCSYYYLSRGCTYTVTPVGSFNITGYIGPQGDTFDQVSKLYGYSVDNGVRIELSADVFTDHGSSKYQVYNGLHTYVSDTMSVATFFSSDNFASYAKSRLDSVDFARSISMLVGLPSDASTFRNLLGLYRIPFCYSNYSYCVNGDPSFHGEYVYYSFISGSPISQPFGLCEIGYSEKIASQVSVSYGPDTPDVIEDKYSTNLRCIRSFAYNGVPSSLYGPFKQTLSDILTPELIDDILGIKRIDVELSSGDLSGSGYVGSPMYYYLFDQLRTLGLSSDVASWSSKEALCVYRMNVFSGVDEFSQPILQSQRYIVTMCGESSPFVDRNFDLNNGLFAYGGEPFSPFRMSQVPIEVPEGTFGEYYSRVLAEGSGEGSSGGSTGTQDPDGGFDGGSGTGSGSDGSSGGVIDDGSGSLISWLDQFTSESSPTEFDVDVEEVVPDLDIGFGVRWLTPRCAPPMAFPVFGHNFYVEFDLACDALEKLSNLILIISMLTGISILFQRGVS